MTSRLTSPHQALRLIPRGATILIAPACASPKTLVGSLVRKAAGNDWTIVGGLQLAPLPIESLLERNLISYRTWQFGGPTRRLAAYQGTSYVPLRASRVAAHLQTAGIDAFLARVSAPDSNGWCSFGPSASYSLAGMTAAAIRIAEVDPAMPVTSGGTAVQLDSFDALVDAAEPMATYQARSDDGVASVIAKHVMKLLPEAPTLQIGIGSAPEAVFSELLRSGAPNLTFVGMVTDSIVDLFEAGLVATNATSHPGVLTPELLGTDRLMDFASRHPEVQLQPSVISHNPSLLSRRDRLVSINSAVEIDLRGEANVEATDRSTISGIGGSVDFAEAALSSRLGRRILVLPSVARGGEVSRIVPRLASAASLPRSLVDSVVTEHGVVHLEGASERDRVELLIGIAHPDHRAMLRDWDPDADCAH